MGAAAAACAAFAGAAAPRAYSMAAGLTGAIAAASLALGRPRTARPFLRGLLVQYVPFLIVNGALTALPVVRYRPEAIVGFRIGSIPLEDAIYCFALFTLPVFLYEAFTHSRSASEAGAGPAPTRAGAEARIGPETARVQGRR
jgi:lycopene cyclase domain-containing protein